jgi:nucleoporin NDC1
VNTFLYLASAFFFGEISVFSAPSSARLYLVDQGGHADRPQINERSILFRSQFIILAFVQVVYHLSVNLDEIVLPLDKLSVQSSGSRLRSALPLVLPRLAISALTKSMVGMFIGILAYYNLYRRTLWNWAFSTLRYTYDFPRNSAPRRSGVPAVINLELKFLYHAFLLTFIWDFTNYVFSTLIVERPLKKGQPITTDSRDPNGTLLSGLKSRRQFWKVRYQVPDHLYSILIGLQSIAFWELVLISNQFESRRVTLYQELERAGGSTWSQVFSLGISQLTAIQERIKAFKGQGTKAAQPSQPAPITNVNNGGIEKQAKKDPSILSPPRRPGSMSGKALALASDFAKSQGSRPGAVPPPHKLLEAGAQRVLSEERLAGLRPEALNARAGGILDTLLKLPVAAPFRQTFGRRVQGVVCASPSSRASIIVDSVSALSSLAVHSLKEDQPGQVQKSIGLLARTIAATVFDIQDFIKTTPPHWTDVYFAPADRTAPEDVSEILDALKSALEEILRAFGEYFGSLGISSDEAKLWKNLVAKPKPKEALRPVTPETRTVR